MQGTSFAALGSENSLIPKRQPDNSEFDITAMIDLVFMMNIYFLVTFLGKASGDIDLPSAVHCAPLDVEKATILTVMGGDDGQTVTIYLGADTSGRALRNPEEQNEEIQAAVAAASLQGKKAVMIRAEKQIRLRELARISSAAAYEGSTLHMAVMEKDTAP